MKKEYKLTIGYNEDSKKVDKPTEEEIEDMDSVWLDTGDKVIQLPKELLPYLDGAEILGIA
mgnify:CR=1 FL=1